MTVARAASEKKKSHGQKSKKKNLMRLERLEICFVDLFIRTVYIMSVILFILPLMQCTGFTVSKLNSLIKLIYTFIFCNCACVIGDRTEVPHPHVKWFFHHFAL